MMEVEPGQLMDPESENTNSNNSAPTEECLLPVGPVESGCTHQIGSEDENKPPLLNGNSDLDPIPPLYKDVKLSICQRLKLTRNLIVVSLCLTLVFSALNGVQNLASSLLAKDSLGVISFSCIYAATIISCFLTPWIIEVCTRKWSFVASLVLATTFLGSMFYPRLWTMVPTSLLWGLAVGPVWTVTSLYVTTNAMDYAVAVQGSVSSYVSRFNGILMMFIQLSQIIGNLISAFVLTQDSRPSDLELGLPCGIQSETRYNVDRNRTKHRELIPYSHEGNETAPSLKVRNDDAVRSAIFTLGSIYLTMVLLAILIAVVFLRPFKHCQAERGYGSALSVASIDHRTGTRHLLMSTVKLLKNPTMYLMLPLSYMVGMQMTYCFADVTKAFVTCGLGVRYIGFTMVAFGVCNSLSCYVGGRLCDILGRPVLFTVAFALNISLYVVMFTWQPTGDVVVYFTMTSVWGVLDGILQPQTMALLGYLFPTKQEGAYANYTWVRHAAMAVTFAYSGYLRLDVKIYIALVVTAFSMVTYYLVEWRVRRGRRNVTG